MKLKRKFLILSVVLAFVLSLSTVSTVFAGVGILSKEYVIGQFDEYVDTECFLLTGVTVTEGGETTDGYELTYDDNDRVASVSYVYYESGEKKTKRTSHFSYDINGNVTLADILGATSSNDDYQLLLTYDEKGNITSQLRKDYDTSTESFKESSKQTYVYDANGYMTSRIGEIYSNANLSFRYSDKTEYVNDEKGRVLEEKEYYYNTTDLIWKQQDTYYAYTYEDTAEGTTTTEICYRSMGDEYLPTNKDVKKVDKNENPLSNVSYYYEDEVEVKSSEEIYEYNDNGLLTKKTYNAYQEGVISDRSEIVITYDDLGRETKNVTNRVGTTTTELHRTDTTYEEIEGGEKVTEKYYERGELLDERIYETKGNVVTFITVEYDDGEFDGGVKWIYTYGDCGQLLSIDKYYATSATEFEEDSKYEFTYTIKHVFKMEIEGQDATEEQAGFKKYYKCSCGQNFEDEECTKEIADIEAWKSEGGAGYIAKIETPTPEEGGLGAGAIIGITVGGILLLLLIAYIVMFFIWKKTDKALPFLKGSYKAIDKALFKKKADATEGSTEEKKE